MISKKAKIQIRSQRSSHNQGIIMTRHSNTVPTIFATFTQFFATQLIIRDFNGRTMTVWMHATLQASGKLSVLGWVTTVGHRAVWSRLNSINISSQDERLERWSCSLIVLVLAYTCVSAN